MHSEWSPQKIPTPSAPPTTFADTSPIDISVIVIARMLVPVIVLPSRCAFAKCVTMPSCPPRTRQPSTVLGGRSNANEMSIPWPYSVAVSTRAVADRDGAAAHVDAVEARPADDDVVERDVLRLLDVEAVVAAEDGHVADLHAARAHDDPAAHDRARLADEVLAPVDHERALVDARAQVHGRRAVGPGDPAREREQRERERRRRGAGGAELAAVLAVGQPQAREDGMDEHLGGEPARRVEGERGP